MALTMGTVTIAAGEFLSTGLSLTTGRLVRIRTPASWKPANLTFRITSAEVDEYWPLYHRDGTEVMLNTVRPNTVIGIPADINEMLEDALGSRSIRATAGGGRARRAGTLRV